MSETVSQFEIAIEQVEGYEFRVKFDKPGHADLMIDEPAPLGKDEAPSPSRILAAAMGSCLSASLLFCLGKKRLQPSGIRTNVKVPILRNDRGRLRVGKVEVTIDPGLAPADLERAKGCVDLFEDFCTVTQSIREGIDMTVSVKGLRE